MKYLGKIVILEKRKWIFILIATAFFLIGYISSSIFKLVPSSNAFVPVQQRHVGEYKLINPLIDVESSQQYPLFESYRQTINDEVNKIISNNKATAMSVYFEDLNNGHWLGVNETDQFVPASMLKVAVLMVYLKEAESDPTFLQQKLTVPNENINKGMYYPPEQAVELGKSYTIDDLLNHMIIYSDNNAYAALFINMINTNKDHWVNLFTRLAVVPQNSAMSAEDYSTFFRVLYNSTYLSNQMSEKALELLTKTTFNDGISKMLPKDIVVAQKFGEKGFTDSIGEENQIEELQNCGIVYFPAHPYIICIMSKGHSMSDLANNIQDISLLVYNQIKNDPNILSK